ncbi:hypothetical protein M0R45_005029 [Rubus argutus]|uniref:Uncharacterized protein n=1 Tax=Rubus argutus TaxID=59490 RepID=A0AAW1YLK5_RUBAR
MAVPKLTTTSPFASRVHYQTSNLCPVQSRLHSHHHVLTFTNSISPKSSPQPHQAAAYLNLPHFHSIRAIPNQPAPPFSANTVQPFNNHSITIIIQSPIIQDSDHRDLITAHFDKPRPHLSRRTSCAVPTPCSSAASKSPGRADRFLRRRRREPKPFPGAPPPLLARAPALLAASCPVLSNSAVAAPLTPPPHALEEPRPPRLPHSPCPFCPVQKSPPGLL